MTGYESKRAAARDKLVQDAFDAWWDSNHNLNEINPCMTDSFEYWAWEGWHAALAQPAQEPPQYSFKAYWAEDGRIGVVGCIIRPDGGPHIVEEFIDPPQRSWVGLTKEAIAEFGTWYDNREEETGWVPPSEVVAYIDAKLKEKNT